MTLRQAQGERIIFNARRLSDDITSVWTTKMRRRRAGSEAQDEAKPDAVKPFGRGQATRVQGVERPIVIPEQVELQVRSEEHTSELQSLMRIPYAVFCLKIKN